jgi:hypothetical protein
MYVSLEWLGLPVLTGQSLAILTLLLMILASMFILRKVTDEHRDWSTLAR